MQIAVFGGTGRTGIPLIEQALNAGHEVKALVRTPSKMPIKHPKLHLIQGDVMDAAQVDRTIEGTDAVLSVLGQSKSSPKDLQTVATRHIIASMKKHSIKRLISLTGAGVADPKDEPKFWNHVIKFLLKTLSGDVLKDGEEHARLIRASGLDWVIVRGPMLTEGPHTGQYRVGYVGVNTGPRISRADVADFMLKQLEDNTYVQKAPMISD